MRYGYKLTEITSLAIQMSMVSLELAIIYKLTPYLTSHPYLHPYKRTAISQSNIKSRFEF